MFLLRPSQRLPYIKCSSIRLSTGSGWTDLTAAGRDTKCSGNFAPASNREPIARVISIDKHLPSKVSGKWLLWVKVKFPDPGTASHVNMIKACYVLAVLEIYFVTFR